MTEQGKQFKKLLNEFADLFVKDINELERTDVVKHRIYTEDVLPIKSRPYSASPDEQAFIEKEIKR
ncbi:32252_t:CDS:1, partial [Racocetra persica]